MSSPTPLLARANFRFKGTNNDELNFKKGNKRGEGEEEERERKRGEMIETFCNDRACVDVREN